MRANTEVETTLKELTAMARERHPDDEVLEEFIVRYYREIRHDDADRRRLEAAYAAAVTHLALGRRRRPGDIQVRVISPDVERDGWHSERSVLMFVADDHPFLVDTLRLVLDRHDLGIHLLVHPMLPVVRDERHVFVGFDDENGSRQREAWTLIELDRCAPGSEHDLERDVEEAIEGVQRVVHDFESMRDRLAALAEGDALLEWLADQHFIFLAAATYDRSTGNGSAPEPSLELREDSALGEYRTAGGLDAVHASPPSSGGSERLVIARTDEVSRIHRAARMTCLAVRTDGGAVEHRFVGLLGSGAYRESVFAIPTIGERAREVIEMAGVSVETHLGRSMRNVLETLPRDLVFELAAQPLAELVLDIVGLQERRIVRVFDIAEPVGPWTTVLVYVPTGRFDTGLRRTVEQMVSDWYHSEVRDVATFVGASSLARLSMTVRRSDEVEHDRLAEAIDVATATWNERAADAMAELMGDKRGATAFQRVRDVVPADYKARTSPSRAAADLGHVVGLLDGDADLDTSFSRTLDDEASRWRFRLFRRDARSTIAELVPLLGQLGLRAVDERPYEFADGGTPVFLYDLGVEVEVGDDALDDDARRAEMSDAFGALLDGRCEADGLNRLILAAGVSYRQVEVLRTYTRYLQQAGFHFSQRYIEDTLVSHPGIARGLIELFEARFDPRAEPSPHESPEAIDALRADLVERLDAVPSLDEDRICRAFLTLIDATLRTNAFRPDRSAMAVKLDSTAIPLLPEPRPMFEIFVCSPLLEGVHLRGGRIARGGIRWSDRPEDFRTEVLGLVKAQMVKNAVIVPVGAKGGFVVKQSTAAAHDRDAVRAEGVDRYRRFIGALLDVTDNLEGGEVVHPPDTVVYDEPDPYLVVAADKGTATFSDIANEIALDSGFWLGDAFASGGSVGYDHKEMGITARGAWESVKRHARVLGKDADRDELTVVGIGDMSGDVFGNGLLRSRHLKLVAAFDHRHVFLDPDPDPEASYEERLRLFRLPRSNWNDYDTDLISDGGGVYSRSLKAVPITSEVRELLEIPADVSALTPAALISAILRAPVDLLWNGGIGTYVKSTTETDDDVGDRTNDVVRIDATELRCRMVGEGGNLGLTQLARVEYAVGGGLIYTDAIDNSAGVDCSDHEVNIKIVLDQVVRDGELTTKQRNALLAEMTDEVADLVLAHNRAQTLALMIARTQALSMVNVHARYLDSLESEGVLDRSLEFLPTDKQIAARQSAGSGLRAPEFAVMIAYTKNVDIAELLDSDVPDDPVLEADLMAYFPAPLTERFPETIRHHRLRREIVATGLVNNMVNLAGISFDHRMVEDSGASIADVTRAFIASRDIFGFDELWREIDRMGDVELDVQIELFHEARRMVERGAGWLLRHRHPPLEIASTIDGFRSGLRFLMSSLDDVVEGSVAEEIAGTAIARSEVGVPEDLAARSSRWRWLHPGFDIVELSNSQGYELDATARAYWQVFEVFDLRWLWDGVGALQRSDRWQNQARASLRDDLLVVLAALARDVIRVSDGDVGEWVRTHSRAVRQAGAMHTEIRRAESFNLTTLTVAIRQLRNLILTGAVERDPTGAATRPAGVSQSESAEG